jgi:hypothetical protein
MKIFRGRMASIPLVPAFVPVHPRLEASPQDALPGIIFILTDAQRADSSGCRGNSDPSRVGNSGKLLAVDCPCQDLRMDPLAVRRSFSLLVSVDDGRTVTPGQGR